MKTTRLKNTTLIIAGAILTTGVGLYAATIDANINSFTQYIQQLFVTSDGTPTGDPIMSVTTDGLNAQVTLEGDSNKQGLLGIGSIQTDDINLSGVFMGYTDAEFDGGGIIGIANLENIIGLPGPTTIINIANSDRQAGILMNAGFGISINIDDEQSETINEITLTSDGVALLHENNQQEVLGIGVTASGVSIFNIDFENSYYFPTTIGTVGQTLALNNLGQLIWTTPGSTSLSMGSTITNSEPGQILYTDIDGNLAGNTGFTYSTDSGLNIQHNLDNNAQGTRSLGEFEPFPGLIVPGMGMMYSGASILSRLGIVDLENTFGIPGGTIALGSENSSNGSSSVLLISADFVMLSQDEEEEDSGGAINGLQINAGGVGLTYERYDEDDEAMELYGFVVNSTGVGLGNILTNNLYYFPIQDGSNGQVLMTDGNGALVFTDLLTTVKATISPSQLSNLNDTSILLLPAPGDNKFIDILSVTVKANHNTTYTNNTDIDIYIGSTDTTSLTTINLGFTDNILQKQGLNTATIQENEGVILRAPDGNPSGGDGSIDIYITFKVVNL